MEGGGETEGVGKRKEGEEGQAGRWEKVVEAVWVWERGGVD